MEKQNEIEKGLPYLLNVIEDSGFRLGLVPDLKKFAECLSRESEIKTEDMRKLIGYYSKMVANTWSWRDQNYHKKEGLANVAILSAEADHGYDKLSGRDYLNVVLELFGDENCYGVAMKSFSDAVGASGKDLVDLIDFSD